MVDVRVVAAPLEVVAVVREALLPIDVTELDDTVEVELVPEDVGVKLATIVRFMCVGGINTSLGGEGQFEKRAVLYPISVSG